MEDIIITPYASTLEITFVITDPKKSLKELTTKTDNFRKETQLKRPFTRFSSCRNYHTETILNLKWLVIWRFVKFVYLACVLRPNKFNF